MYEPEIPPEVGQTILWASGVSDPEWAPALVTAVGTDGQVNCLMVPDGWDSPNYRDGVRHERDPDAPKYAALDQGVWRHTPQTLRLRDLNDRLEFLDDLDRRLRSLEEALGSQPTEHHAELIDGRAVVA